MGSRKGGKFEREIAKTLSRWFTHGADETQLVRSVSSGGWKFRKEQQCGDLAANGPDGRRFRQIFTVECKARKEFEFRHIWSSGAPAIGEWWKQVWTEAEDFNLLPILIYRKPYHPTLLGLPPDLLDILLPEARKVRITWGDLEYKPLGLTDFDELLALDPDWVIDVGQRYLSSE